MEEQDLQLVLYLCFGDHPDQSSLLTRFSLERKYAYVDCEYKQNIFEHALQMEAGMQSKSAILNNIPLDINNFVQAEKNFKQHRTVALYFKSNGNGKGKDEAKEKIARHYRKLGVLKVLELEQGNVQQEYKQLKRRLLSKVIFVYGPPKSRKTDFAHKIAETLGYTYVYFDDLRKKFGENDQVSLANKLIKYLSSTDRHIVFDGFFKSKTPLSVLSQSLQPVKVYHVQCSNDQVQGQLQQIKDKQLKASKVRQFEEYLNHRAEITNYLKDKPYYQNLTLENFQDTLANVQPTLLYVKHNNREFIQELAETWDGTHLNLEQMMVVEKERQKLTVGDNIEHKLEYLKKVIGSSNGRIILSGFSDKVDDFVQLQNSVAPIKYYFTFIDQEPKYSQVVTPEMYYLGKQKLVTLETQSSSLVLSYLDRRNPYLTISGPECSGKSELAKIIARDYGYKHIEFEPFITEYKEKNPSEDNDELPLAKIIKIFKDQIASKKAKYIIEGLPYEGKDLELWIKEVGCPTSINLKLDNEHWLLRYRKKQQIGLEAEITEEDQERTTSAQQKNADYVKSLEEVYQKHPNIKLFQFDCNGPLITLENFLPLILRPRVYLVCQRQTGQDLLFLNIAIKHRMSYIDLSITELKSIPAITQGNSLQRDIILYNYSSQDRLVSNDVYFIENNIGTVRFICAWTEENREFNDPKMTLERPIVQTKKKQIEQGKENDQPVEGEPLGEEDLDENGEPRKPKFDIYSYEWTQPGTSKTLTQWFLNSKKPVKQYLFEQSNQRQVYDDFELVINQLNRDRTSNIYALIK